MSDSESKSPVPVPITRMEQLLGNKEDDDILKELCVVNGIKYSKLGNGGGDHVELLEIFFSGYPRMLGLKFFPNVTTIIIMGQDISCIDGLQYSSKLEELWVSECKLTTIGDLKGCPRLKKLYLYDNQLQRIESLSHLKHLQVLWLNHNNIANIEGLNGLTALSELNLADNKIEKIGHSLDNHDKLENLNLSGNNICSFKDITHLVRLPRLRILGLKDPLYAPNPVCYLCNYSTHVLYHLPWLERLDTYDVCNKSLREMAEATVMKKKMYYNMRVKTMKRNMSDILRQLCKEKRALTRGTKDRLKALSFAIKELERELESKASGGRIVSRPVEDDVGSGTESDIQEDSSSLETKRKAKLALMQKRYEKCCLLFEDVEKYHNEAILKVKHATAGATQRLVTELETGGNVRFEDGTTSDIWFTSCHDLILSRFCASDYQAHGITGLKIHRITRVHNRMLRYRFDTCLATFSEEDDTPTLARPQSMKKLQEYLFFVWDPELPGGENQPMKVLEDGPMDQETYRQLGRDGAVPLSNSLSLCEKPRIQYLTSKSRTDPTAHDPCPFRHGQLVVCKVYLGKSLPALDVTTGIHQKFYPNCDSVFRPKCFSGGVQEESLCECSSRQCEWFVFNNELVLPEYVIDFEYVTRLPSPSPFMNVMDIKQGEKAKRPAAFNVDPQADDDLLLMEPVSQPRPRLSMLTEELLLKATKASSLSSITVLNLHGNGLTKLKHLSAMTSLQRLVVSFNELSRLEDVAHMANLEYLDASFNKIYTLDGMKALGKLKILDLSWNEMTNTRDDLSILRKHSPNLTCLELRHNNWQKPEGLRLRTIGRLKSLTTLNGQAVTEAEATAALRMAAGSRISQVSLLAHTRTDECRPRSLSLVSCAQLLTNVSRNKPDRQSESDSEWYTKVTTLNLDSQHISKLSNLERLVNLRWASFNDNDLTKIEGLDNCLQIEELSLEDNCIYRIEGISHLSKLHTLNLGTNNLSTLENAGLDKLVHLQCLSVEDNRISTLAGLDKVTSLLELYVGNNNIRNIREVFHLKPLPNFVILDMCGNPVAKESDNYRLFVVYHLKSLKALDGSAVESTEGGTARDTFGGRLNQDFVAEKLGHSNFHEIRELDFPQCGIRQVDLGSGEHFINLRSVNLEHNNLTSFSGLIYLVNLRVLCLNHNHVETILQRPKASKGSKVDKDDHIDHHFLPGTLTPILDNLEVLHLGYNGISDLNKLEMSRLPSLKALFLQGNDISKVEGMDGLQDLRELVLDRNKIKSVGEGSFINQWNLVELHLEENRLRDLSNLQYLENLQRLYVGSNRIQDMSELEKLDRLPNLIELSVISNPVSRRLMHRPMLVYRQPNLLCIDGIPVTQEERTKAELYFMEQQVVTAVCLSPFRPSSMMTNETTLPGISSYKGHPAPVKITNVQLQGGSSDRHGWSTQVQYAPGDDVTLPSDSHRAPNRRQRSYGKNDVQSSPSNTGSRSQYSNATGGSRHSGQQYQTHYQVPYVPHQSRSQGYEGYSGSNVRHNRPR
ncbi:leucine-rich repeat-containing protein 9-like isoform X1 [Lytechinus variegatus]|uniref:leucine-rich repeat-containing protein 9-like isoform X1 n=1 Tax=Lytechinus variegatus TaxID=7654 RepID=UPI001BB152EA|nr:leucine-rich repeat-containing protein 9-like isoform X1 [Lytechinus variegatus]XP_041469373.1 leucine-rich repeat-containing protein 9-like isoform X1 [Lytechinus variegatus]